jgi:hypothetical protein
MKYLWPMLIAVLISSSSQAELTRNRDGNWWRTQMRVEKMAYMTGFLDGMNLGNNLSVRMIDDKTGKDTIDLANHSYDYLIRKYLNNVSNDQIADGLDTLYSDYRNRNIGISNAVWVTLLSIAGTPQAEIDKNLEDFRKNANR